MSVIQRKTSSTVSVRLNKNSSTKVSLPIYAHQAIVGLYGIRGASTFIGDAAREGKERGDRSLSGYARDVVFYDLLRADLLPADYRPTSNVEIFSVIDADGKRSPVRVPNAMAEAYSELNSDLSLKEFLNVIGRRIKKGPSVVFADEVCYRLMREMLDYENDFQRPQGLILS
ncbi:hypothetical protein [Thaumasiovibrio sp. DFM-14]|uniref:hypothetical protein n=1 Tax=Thaumasiovibrio sp. DFM-14 TaxID=3384792 RepID=UPI00399FCAED